MPPARFLTDSSLESLARRLRFLGYDVVTLGGARLEEVLAAARREDRTVLTLSARRPRRWADVRAITVERGDEAGAVRKVAASCEPAGPPFSRCGACGTALERRHAFEARGEVPGRVLRSAPFLHYCPICGKWYWEGTHVARIREWLERALGRPLEPPGGTPSVRDRVLDSTLARTPDLRRRYAAPAEALPTRMDLSLILVNYKSREPLLACLRALRDDARAAGIRTETVVVDNDSRDGTPEALAAEFPDARLIANRENVGYARAVNQGLAATGAPFALVLNPDCTVRAGALRALLDHAAAHPRAGLIGPRILNPDGSLEYSARAFPDHLTFLFNRYSLLTRLFPGNRFSRRYLLTDWDHASAREVDWISGACMLARRSAVERVGGMDEAFFMFNEDVDWCHRMKPAGWTVTYEPAAVVVHHVGASRSRVAARVIWGRHLGMIHYFHKHHPTNPLLSLPADALILLRAGLMVLANALRLRG